MEIKEQLDMYRTEIDKIDEEILKLFLKRMEVSKNIGNFKKKHNLEIFDEAREVYILENKTKNIEDESMRKFSKELFLKLLELSKEVQK